MSLFQIVSGSNFYFARLMPVELAGGCLLRWDSHKISVEEEVSGYATAQQPDGLHCGLGVKAENRCQAGAQVEDRRQKTDTSAHAIASAAVSPPAPISRMPLIANARALQSLAEKSHFRSSHRNILGAISRHELSN